VFSLSRGAIISLAIFGCAAVIALAILRFTTTTQSTMPTIIPVVVALGVMGTVGWMVRQVDFSEVYYRLEQLSKLQANDLSLASWQLAGEATTEMFEDRW